MAIQETVYLTLSADDTREMEWGITLNTDVEGKDIFITEVTSASGNSTIPSREIPVIARREDYEFVHLSLTNDEVRQLSADERIFDIQNLVFDETLLEPCEIRVNPPVLSAYDPYTAEIYDFNQSAPISVQGSFNTAYAPMHRILNTSSEYIRTTIGYLSGQLDPSTFALIPGRTEVRSDSFNGNVTQILVPNQKFYGQGQDVDVIITDDPVSYDMGEWQDPDTGVSRFVQYDWFNSDLENLLNQKYNNSIPNQYKGSTRGSLTDGNGDPLPADYRYRSNADNQYYHGTHVASTVAGRFYGYASKANIYHINVLASGDQDEGYGYIPSYLLADFIRGFHALKPINPRTGRKNPTLVQASWGSNYRALLAATFPSGIQLSNINSYQWFDESTGNQIVPPFSPTNLPAGYGDGTWTASNLYEQFGLRFGVKGHQMPVGNSLAQQSMLRMVRDGIILVVAAGNDDTYINHSLYNSDYFRSSHPDWSGRLAHSGSWSTNSYIYPEGKSGTMSNSTRVSFGSPANLTLFHHRASSPIIPGAICVGSTDTLKHERKTEFSNYGPAVDVFAPGEDVLGAYNSTGTADGKYGGSGQHQYFNKISGTSMAAPQVCGILAVAASNKSRFTPLDAKGYLQTVGLSGIINANQGHRQRRSSLSINSETETSFTSGARFNDQHSLRDSQNLTVRMMNPRAVLTRSYSAHPNFTDSAGVALGYTDGKGAGRILNGGHYQTLQMWDFATNGTAVRTVNNSLDDPASHGYFGDNISTVTGGQVANYKTGSRLHQHNYFIPESVPGDSSAVQFQNLYYWSTQLYPITKSEKWNENQYGRRGSNQKWPRPGIFMDSPTSMLSTLAVNHSEYAGEAAGGNSSARIKVLARDPV